MLRVPGDPIDRNFKGNGKMNQVLESIMGHLRERSATVSTAESCTGGLIAALLTELPGSSEVYVGGVSAYSNSAKQLLISVPAELIEEHGAVSREVALAMATGVKKALRTNFSVSITGIAGPGGATGGKPVGTVWCGVAGPKAVDAVCWHLKGDRNAIREQAAQQALKFFLSFLLNHIKDSTL